jgi:hypothetical protein
VAVRDHGPAQALARVAAGLADLDPERLEALRRTDLVRAHGDLPPTPALEHDHAVAVGRDHEVFVDPVLDGPVDLVLRRLVPGPRLEVLVPGSLLDIQILGPSPERARGALERERGLPARLRLVLRLRHADPPCRWWCRGDTTRV